MDVGNFISYTFFCICVVIIIHYNRIVTMTFSVTANMGKKSIVFDLKNQIEYIARIQENQNHLLLNIEKKRTRGTLCRSVFRFVGLFFLVG